MVGNWRIILTWLGRALVIFPKWWNYEYKDFRLIVEQDSLLRYFKMPAALQRAAARCAIAGFSMASISLAGLCLTSFFLNTEKARLENSMHTQLGNTVVLQHNNGIQTLYAHLQDIEVQVGENVQLDTILGTVGNTGASSTGPHLHFEVLAGGFSANPIKVIRAARNVQQIN